VLVATAGTLLLAARPEAAGASEFTISACQADRSEFSTQAFEDFATRGMLWKRACDPEGPGLRGLVTSNVVRAGRVERGARSQFVLRAPEGTRFGRFSWSGQARRHDCRYALQLWADRPDGPPVSIKNVRANRGCPNHGRIQIAGWPAPNTYDVSGATKIVQRAVCVGAPKTPYCSAHSLNYIRTFKALATVVDASPPSVTIAQDNPFTRGEWVRGSQSVGYAAFDNVGVRVARAVVGDKTGEDHLRGCNFALRIPCPSGSGAITVDTRRLPEGSQPLLVQAEDAAANPGVSGALTVRIDNTAPGAASAFVEGGEGWRNQNLFSLAWDNPDEGDRAPIVGVHHRVCPLDGNSCTHGSRAAPGIDRLSDVAVPGPGEWHLRLWRQDAAGNHEPANASVPVTLRFDPEPPQLGFEDSPASDPTLVSVLVTDKVSGLAGGEIELSREGSASWQVLATHQEGSHLTARLDDENLPPGTYLLRATARDRAGNQNSADTRLDGRPMAISLPVRTPTALRAGVVTRRSVRRTGRRRGERHRVRRRITVLRPTARIALGRGVKIAGQLRRANGDPVRDAEVLVLTRSPTSPEQVVGTLRTDDHGAYEYVARAGSTSTLRVVFGGTPLLLPAQREVTLRVPAESTIRTRPRRVRNGQAVTFDGRLRSLPVPAAGKLIELQVVLSGRWQTFRTVRTSPSGSWRVRYRFRRSCGVLRYRFRARLPAEAGYPFEAGETDPVAVLVQGKPCR
jgi:hypothetical protein